MEIRRAIQSDSEGIHRLIYLTSLQCCFSEAEPCPEWFVASIGPEKIEAFIEDEQYCWLVASKENEVVGVLAIIEGKLIKYFFVHPNFHRNGVARSLWKLAAPVLEPEVTVRSSVFAIRFYESLGFKKLAALKISKDCNIKQWLQISKS